MKVEAVKDKRKMLQNQVRKLTKVGEATAEPQLLILGRITRAAARGPTAHRSALESSRLVCTISAPRRAATERGQVRGSEVARGRYGELRITHDLEYRRSAS